MFSRPGKEKGRRRQSAGDGKGNNATKYDATTITRVERNCKYEFDNYFDSVMGFAFSFVFLALP